MKVGKRRPQSPQGKLNHPFILNHVNFYSIGLLMSIPNVL